MMRTGFSRVEVLACMLAVLMAGAVWLPPSVGDGPSIPVRALTWIGRNDPQIRIGSLTAKPLLDPTRGKIVPSTTAPPVSSDVGGSVLAADVSRRYILRGLARIDDRDVAVIEDRAANRVVRLQRGQVVGDWHLAGVSGSQATLKNEAGLEEKLILVPAIPRSALTPAVTPLGAGPAVPKR
jgi:hypothetical protein